MKRTKDHLWEVAVKTLGVEYVQEKMWGTRFYHDPKSAIVINNAEQLEKLLDALEGLEVF